jgi:hypothetical protein
MDDGLSVIASAEVDEFVDTHIASFACWDLAAFACLSPQTRADARQWSRLLARQDAEVTSAIEHLIATGLLVADDRPGATPVFRLCDDLRTRLVLSRFVTDSRTRERRLEFVRRVIGHITGN